MAEARTNGGKSPLQIAVIVGELFVGSIVVILIARALSVRSASAIMPKVQSVEGAGQRVPLGTMTAGSPRARIAMIEFSDFQCPFCGRYAREIYPQLRRKYVDSGQVVYAFHHFPLTNIHPNALAAAVSVDCAGERHLEWKLHDVLFTRQQDLSRTALLRYGGDVGLDTQSLSHCLDGIGRQAIKDQMAVATSLGIKSTPTFLFGIVEEQNVRVLKRVAGAGPLNVFVTVLDELLEREGIRQ